VLKKVNNKRNNFTHFPENSNRRQSGGEQNVLLGIAIHNFHDTIQRLPPATLGGDNNEKFVYPGFWILI
jgi:hypothetical protein